MNKDKIKIVFFGTPDFAVASLNAIVEKGYEVAAVVTATDKIAGRGHKLLCSAVKTYALEKNIPVLQPEKLKSEEFITQLREIDADLFVVIAFRMLPEVVWSMPRLGTFNLHASLLPKYRGAAPINRAVMAGETKTGVTTFFLQHEIDTGDIIDRVEIDITPNDNAGSVHDKLMALGAELTVKTIDDICAGTLKTVPQSQLIEQGTISCPAPKIFKETGNIDWQDCSENVHNLVRGLSPYPGAWTTLKSETSKPIEIKIFKTGLTDRKPQGDAGDVLVENDRMYINCGDFQIEVFELQPAGKKRMDAASYMRGARLVGAQCIKENN